MATEQTKEVAEKPIVIQPPKLSEALLAGSEQIVANANAMVVKTREDLAGPAADALTKIKKQYKLLEDERVDMKAPILEAGRKVDGLFKPALKVLDEASDVIKKKMIDAKRKFDKEDEEKQAKILARSEKAGRGRITEETAINQISEIPTVKKTTQTASGGSTTFKKVQQVTITDLKAIPVEYLRPGTVEEFMDFKPWPAIQKAAKQLDTLIQAGHPNIQQIPGVKVEMVDSLSARG